MARTHLLAKTRGEAPRVVKDAVCRELKAEKKNKRAVAAAAAKTAKAKRKAKTQQRKEKMAAAKAAKAQRKKKEAPPENVLKSQNHFEVLKGFI